MRPAVIDFTAEDLAFALDVQGATLGPDEIAEGKRRMNGIAKTEAVTRAYQEFGNPEMPLRVFALIYLRSLTDQSVLVAMATEFILAQEKVH